MLEHVFDAELRLRGGMEPIAAREGAGALIGSGDGSVSGTRLAQDRVWKAAATLATEATFKPTASILSPVGRRPIASALLARCMVGADRRRGAGWPGLLRGPELPQLLRRRDHPEASGASISIPEATEPGRVLFADVLTEG